MIRQHLSDYFWLAAKNNSQFSVRAFALRLGESNSALSEMLRGKRSISKNKALAFAEKIKLSEKQIEAIRLAFENENSLARLNDVKNPLREVLIPPEMQHIMADWRYFVILALIRTSKRKPATVGSLSRALGMPIKVVEELLNELVRLDIVKFNSKGEYTSEPILFRTTENFPDALMNQRRLDGLAGAREGIEEHRAGSASYFSTVSVNAEQVEAAKNIFEDFLKRISLHLRDPEASEVFEVHVNVFPRTVRPHGS